MLFTFFDLFWKLDSLIILIDWSNHQACVFSC